MNISNRSSPHGEVSAAHGAPVTWLLRLLVVLGLVLPWIFNVRYFMAGGHVLPGIFFRDVAANHLTTAITIDVYLAAVAFSVWVLSEKRVERAWLYVAACFGLGLAFAFPLYLLRRSKA